MATFTSERTTRTDPADRGFPVNGDFVPTGVPFSATGEPVPSNFVDTGPRTFTTVAPGAREAQRPQVEAALKAADDADKTRTLLLAAGVAALAFFVLS